MRSILILVLLAYFKGLTANFSWQYQTGAASARPAHKQRVRASAAKLRTATAAHTLALTSGAVTSRATAALNVATDALGVTQHHDSLPGTMQAAESFDCPNDISVVDGFDNCSTTTDPNRQVLEDYTKRLEEADVATDKLTADSVCAKAPHRPSGSLSLSPPSQSAAVDNVAASVVIFNPHERRACSGRV